jgi:TPR repeat protein
VYYDVYEKLLKIFENFSLSKFLLLKKLGNFSYKGQGGTQDYVRAHMWANLAAVHGGTDAVKNRNELARKMTPQQLEKAQKMARNCQAKSFKNCD